MLRSSRARKKARCICASNTWLLNYWLQILAQKGSNPTVVTILLSLESVFAVIAGAIILHQSMTPREYLGCALMFLAVVLAQIPLPAKTARAEQ